MAPPAGRLDPDRVSELVLSRRPDAILEYLALIPGSLDDHECGNLRVLAQNLREHLLRAEARRGGSAESYDVSRIAKQARKIAARSRICGNTTTGLNGSEGVNPSRDLSASENQTEVSPISDTKGKRLLSGFVQNEDISSYSDESCIGTALRWDELTKEEKKKMRKELKAEGVQIRRHENRLPNLKKKTAESYETYLRAHLRDGNA